MIKKLKYDFYQVTMPGDARVDFGEMLRRISILQGRQRLDSSGANPIRLHLLDQRPTDILGDIARIRMNDSQKQIKQAFKDKDYRHGYADEFLNTNIATQIKALREQRGWSQQKLADNAHMMQPRISAMENVNYSSWSINILKRLAEAFDVTLNVSFESFGKRLVDFDNFTRENLERPSFPEDHYFFGAKKDD